MVSVDNMAGEIQELGPLPLAGNLLAEVILNPRADLREAIKAIRYDQALTATILRHANSAQSAPTTPIGTVGEALIRLGAGKVLGLALALWVRSPMSAPLPPYGFGERELWRHSATAALATDILSTRTGQRLPALTFTAALLHDIGKLVLARHLDPGTLDAIWRRVVPGETTYAEAEVQTLGFGHAELGASIAERWRLGKALALAIEQHHHPEAADNPVCAAVQVCNLVAKTVGCGVGFEGMNLLSPHAALERFGLRQKAFERMCAEVAAAVPEVESELG